MIRLATILLLLTAFAEARFTESDISTALAKAKKAHRPVFVDAYASWCAPCKELRKTTFKNKRVAAYLNNHYINAAIDVEKGNGMQFAEKYHIESYPTLLLIDENGKEVKRIEGFVDATELAQKLDMK
ncbi:thioredoxin fold domain-containing protein [Mucilaginibacter mali]|uniref:Thioredoxin fold domain-containing protein n=1 Tax=Mucilaginibacter mali TaxID=2740462 RepID=A0A7D4Q846_9SPHI|nr:thioredoxin fold domain-containing protein [Mucilaginibacter mali]QKJ30491.1 thioredoxin fold domain-containing protein [Mucilaginibacter mali]